jgi:carbonic anhydrase/acetyltransferase-like protein (isoleucine patch superfamily)
MPLYSLGGTSPQIHPGAWVAPTASLVGDVVVQAGASVWFNAVIRADFGQIVIGADSSFQDGSVLHAGAQGALIGSGTTVGHGCIVHGATIGPGTLVGNRAVVLDNASIGSGCIVAAGSVVVPRSHFDDGTFIVGSPATARGPVSHHLADLPAHGVVAYAELVRRYARDCLPVPQMHET